MRRQVEAFVVDTANSQNHSEVPTLCQEGVVIPEAVEIYLGVQRSRFLPRPDDLIEAEHLSDLDQWKFLLCGVVTCSEALALGENSQHRGVRVRDPATEDETADEDNNPGKETFEEIENSDRADAHKVEDGPLDSQVRKGLVQALEDSAASLEIGFLHESPRYSLGCEWGIEFFAVS